MLYPQTEETPTHRTGSASNYVQQPATFAIPPNHTTRSASYSPGQISQISRQAHHRRTSAHQLASANQQSPIQNPRVSGIIESSSPSHGYNSTIGQHQRFYASSAPNSSGNLNAQGNSPSTRPPVPLFSQSTGSIQTTASVRHKVSQGSPPSHLPTASSSADVRLTESPIDMEMADADFAQMLSGGDRLTELDEILDFSNGNSFNSSNENAQQNFTVSPHDVLLDNVSAPPSTSMTNLTTPGTTFDSPMWANGSNETSPLFGEEGLDDDANHWPPLFEPPNEQLQSVPMTHTLSNVSTTSSGNYNTSPTVGQPAGARMSRNNSSPGQTGSKSGRHSFTAGVHPRKRDKPLPAITVEDPSDSVAIKRARNTMAARKSRQKRVERTEQLESEIEELQGQVEHWKNIALTHGYVG